MPATLTEVCPTELSGSLLFRADIYAHSKEVWDLEGDEPVRKMQPEHPERHIPSAADMPVIADWLSSFGLDHVTAVALFCRDGRELHHAIDDADVAPVASDGRYYLAVTQQQRDTRADGKEVPVVDYASDRVATIYRVFDLGSDATWPEALNKYAPENYSWA